MENFKIEAMRNVIHYTDEYFELVDALLDLKISDDERNNMATLIFKAIAAGEQIAYEGMDNGNVHGVGKLIES